MTGAAAVSSANVARDVTPNAVNWADIIAATGATTANSNQTLTGFVGVISLQIDFTNNTGETTLKYRVNSGTYTTFTTGAVISISPGDTLNFQTVHLGLGDGGTVTVKNNSAGGVTLDTFNYSNA